MRRLLVPARVTLPDGRVLGTKAEPATVFSGPDGTVVYGWDSASRQVVEKLRSSQQAQLVSYRTWTVDLDGDGDATIEQGDYGCACGSPVKRFWPRVRRAAGT